jgi:hypothetical protein
MLYICKNVHVEGRGQSNKNDFMADPGHGNALVIEATNGDLIKVVSSKKLVRHEKAIQKLQSRLDMLVNQQDTVKESQSKFNQAKENH